MEQSGPVWGGTGAGAGVALTTGPPTPTLIAPHIIGGGDGAPPTRHTSMDGFRSSPRATSEREREHRDRAGGRPGSSGGRRRPQTEPKGRPAAGAHAVTTARHAIRLPEVADAADGNGGSLSAPSPSSSLLWAEEQLCVRTSSTMLPAPEDVALPVISTVNRQMRKRLDRFPVFDQQQMEKARGWMGWQRQCAVILVVVVVVVWSAHGASSSLREPQRRLSE
jgi:hypothetical protein